ncbi:hypothetical protein DMENIID0001_138190 [Sergentomyia squamirostris]
MSLTSGICVSSEKSKKPLQLKKIYFEAGFEPSTLYPSGCTRCSSSQKYFNFRFWFVNEHEAVYKCENSTCLYPFREFIFMNRKDKTIYRYQIRTDVTSTDPSDPAPRLDESLKLPEVDNSVFDDPNLDFDTIAALSGINELSCSEDSSECVDLDLDALLGENTSDNHVEESIKKWLEDSLNQDIPVGKDDSRKKVQDPAPNKLTKSIDTFTKIHKPEIPEIINQKPKENEILQSKMSPLEFLRKVKGIKSISNTSSGLMTTHSYDPFKATEAQERRMGRRRELARLDLFLDEKNYNTTTKIKAPNVNEPNEPKNVKSPKKTSKTTSTASAKSPKSPKKAGRRTKK